MGRAIAETRHRSPSLVLCSSAPAYPRHAGSGVARISRSEPKHSLRRRALSSRSAREMLADASRRSAAEHYVASCSSVTTPKSRRSPSISLAKGPKNCRRPDEGKATRPRGSWSSRSSSEPGLEGDVNSGSPGRRTRCFMPDVETRPWRRLRNPPGPISPMARS